MAGNDRGAASRDRRPADDAEEPDVELEDHDPEDDDLDEELEEELVVEASLAELKDENGEIAAPDTDLVIGRGPDQRVPAWLDTAVQYTWRGLVLALGVTAVIVVMTRLYLVTLPIIVALILATLCVPPARMLEQRGVPRMLAAIIVVIGGIGSLGGIIALMTPAFIRQVQELQPTVAAGIDSVLQWLEEGPIGWDRTEIENLFNQAMESLEGAAGTIASQVGSIAVAVVEGITALVLAIVLLFFFVKDGDQIVRWFITRVPGHHRDTFRAAGARGWAALSGFVRGTAAVALIDAVGIGIGLAIVGVPLVLPLSVLVFFGGFIPVIGATVTGILAALVALASGGLSDAIIVALIVLAVQQIESNVLQPTIMRRAVALHPVVILGVLTGGAVLIGIVGAFLAVPVAAVLAAVGNELRLRHELGKQGAVAGPRPIGGPGVDPTTVKVQFPEDTQLRAARPRRRKRDGDDEGGRTRTRTRERVSATRKHRDAPATEPSRTTPTTTRTDDDRARSTGAPSDQAPDGRTTAESHPVPEVASPDAPPARTATGTGGRPGAARDAKSSGPGAARDAKSSGRVRRTPAPDGPASSPGDGYEPPSHVEVVRPPGHNDDDTDEHE